jgi:FAD/FMN-containing dehydrogenase
VSEPRNTSDPEKPDLRAEMERISAEFRAAREAGERVRLAKPTSNLFRQRKGFSGRMINVGAFDRVLEVNADEGYADVCGMTPYDAVVDETLKVGRMPAVVPELKSITVGGAVTGGGIESSSFRYGFVHETVLEMDVLTASGEVLCCRPDNEHAELFYGFANSYGTLGYALRLRIQVVPTKPFVRLRHEGFEDGEAYFAAMEGICRSSRGGAEGPAFVDGTVFREGEYYRTLGEGSESGDVASDYSFMRPYYRSIRE